MTMTFTKPKRKKLSISVARIFSNAMNVPITFGAHPILGGVDEDYELDYRRENFMTVNGECRHVHLQVTHRGLDVHIKFNEPKKAAPNCPDINPFSGKWNHYLWPSNVPDGANLFDIVTLEATRIAERLRPPPF